MATNETVKNLLDEMLRIENEVSLLREERKDILDRFKSEVDIKSFKAALQVAKIKMKIDHQDEFEQILDVVDKAL